MGYSIAGASNGAPTSSGDPLGEFIDKNMPTWEQRQANYDQIVGAFGQDYSGNRLPGVQVAGGGRDENIARMLRLANEPGAAGGPAPFRVEVNGAGWTPSKAMPMLADGTPVWQSTDPTDSRLLVEVLGASGADAPFLPGYGLTGAQTYQQLGTTELYYTPGSGNGPSLPALVVSEQYGFDGSNSDYSNVLNGIGTGAFAGTPRISTPIFTNPTTLFNQTPANGGTWTGTRGNSGWRSTDPTVTAVTHGRPVKFSGNYPNFGPWTQQRIVVPKLTGTNSDFALGHAKLKEQMNLASNAAAERWLRAQGLTLHHHQNGATLDLVPTDLHNNVKHPGGASNLRDWNSKVAGGTPVDYLKANRIVNAGRAIGVVGMAYGAYADGSSLYSQIQTSRRTGSYANTLSESARIAGGWTGAYAVGASFGQIGAAFGLAVGGPVGAAAFGLLGGVVGGGLGYWGGSYAASGIANDIQNGHR